MTEDRHQLPSWASLRAFDAAGRTGSFKGAADELHVTASSVSHQIRNLEQLLGSSLFVRRTRAVELTPLGARYLEAVRVAFDDLVRATDDVRGREPHEPLRIGMLPFTASEVFVPAVRRLADWMPSVEFEIESRIHLRDLRTDDEGGRLDAVIRYGTGDFEGLKGTLLTSIQLVPVCSPDWLRSHPISEPRDLKHKRLVVLKDQFQGWSRWGAAHGVDLTGASETLSFDNYASAIHAVQRGLGMGLGLFPMLKPWVADGRIVLPLDLPVAIPEAMYLVFVPGGERQAQLELLGERLRALLCEPPQASSLE